jgi:hypothetical protein
MNFSDIKNIIDSNRFDTFYKEIKKKKSNKKFDISIIIPVRGRIDFLNICLTHLKSAINRTNLKINITIIEHSNKREYYEICKSNDIGYYWINSLENKFNKCLCHNIGSLLNKNSNYFLFHDLDCLVYDNFLINLIENKEYKKSECLQTFYNRRVLYLNEVQTEKLINNRITINEINLDDVREGDYGAPGGSILVNKDLFFSVGGYDPELFYGWSPEDIFFWDKIETIEKIHSVDNPKNELLHLHHQIQSDKDSLLLEELYENIKKLGNVVLNDVVNYKSEIIKKYI